MAKKYTAKELRDQAKKLLEEANKIDDAECLKLGKVVKKYIDNDFKNFDLAKFKKELGFKEEKNVPDLKKVESSAAAS